MNTILWNKYCNYEHLLYGYDAIYMLIFRNKKQVENLYYFDKKRKQTHSSILDDDLTNLYYYFTIILFSCTSVHAASVQIHIVIITHR